MLKSVHENKINFKLDMLPALKWRQTAYLKYESEN